VPLCFAFADATIAADPSPAITDRRACAPLPHRLRKLPATANFLVYTARKLRIAFRADFAAASNRLPPRGGGSADYVFE
jgi:hypothetical protein